MTPLHPAQLTVLRVRGAIAGVAILLIALALDLGPLREAKLPTGLVTAIAAAVAAVLVLLLPGRRYRAWGYRETGDEIHIRHGVMVRVRTIVPFSRVQHTDVSQGPVERACGVATLIVHTAGTRGAAVALPGLAPAEAERMRDRIRARMGEPE
ncbi:MAG TPA: PH domain-containing protein [Allosphingosinicella sp.]|jgi:hypothetical protein